MADRGPDTNGALRLDLVEVDDLCADQNAEVHQLSRGCGQQDERGVQQDGQVVVAEEVLR